MQSTACFVFIDLRALGCKKKLEALQINAVACGFPRKREEMKATRMTLNSLLSFLERRGKLSLPELEFLQVLQKLAEEEDSYRVFARSSGYLSAVVEARTLIRAVLEFPHERGEHPALVLCRRGFLESFYGGGGLEVAPYPVWEAIEAEAEAEEILCRVEEAGYEPLHLDEATSEDGDLLGDDPRGV